MANPGVVGGQPKVPTLSAPPSPSFNAKSARAVAASPDFAADLARLVSLLAGARPNAMSPSGSPEPLMDVGAELSTSDQTGDAVEALCAEVALSVPEAAPPVSEAAPPVPVPTPSIPVSAEPPTSDPEVPLTGGGTEGPSRTLQVLLTPPGMAHAAEHRSARAPTDGPTMPTLPLLPAAAAGASAFTVVSEDLPDAIAPGTVAAPTPLDVTSSPLPAAPLDATARPVATPHAVAATVVDMMQPQASRQIAETVVWHVPVQGAAEVQIRLNPEELGPMDVQLKVDGDKVSVRFDLADERVRDVVQSSLPSLSSMLSARGLQLDQAQVFSQQRGQGSPQQHAHQQAQGSSAGSSGGDSELTLNAVTRPLIRRGLLDDYA